MSIVWLIYNALPQWKRRAQKKCCIRIHSGSDRRSLFPQWKRYCFHSGSDTVSTVEVDSKLLRVGIELKKKAQDLKAAGKNPKEKKSEQ